jgi:hypothetical protein
MSKEVAERQKADYMGWRSIKIYQKIFSLLSNIDS